jgi:indolepyruvate ferredoxin oxidoreductase beta subunit
VKCDILLAGVGGQGVLTIAAIIAGAARREGLHVKQVEVHGMAQRGGAVQAHLRLSDAPIASDLVPKGAADLLLATEPVESLRYLEHLSPGGRVVSSTDPVRNVPDYPPLEEVRAALEALPGVVLVPAEALAREAGAVRAANLVVVGAACDLLPLRPESLEDHVREALADRGEAVVRDNLKALRAGRRAARCAVPS